jgi:hypothetical protein
MLLEGWPCALNGALTSKHLQLYCSFLPSRRLENILSRGTRIVHASDLNHRIAPHLAALAPSHSPALPLLFLLSLSNL